MKTILKHIALAAILITAAHAQTSLTATWTDNADNEDTQWLEALYASGQWIQVSGSQVAADVETVDFDWVPEMLQLRVAASNAFGQAYSDPVLTAKPPKPGKPNLIRRVGNAVSKLFQRNKGPNHSRDS